MPLSWPSNESHLMDLADLVDEFRLLMVLPVARLGQSLFRGRSTASEFLRMKSQSGTSELESGSSSTSAKLVKAPGLEGKAN
jgi:hypothetical protein